MWKNIRTFTNGGIRRGGTKDYEKWTGKAFIFEEIRNGNSIKVGKWGIKEIWRKCKINGKID